MSDDDDDNVVPFPTVTSTHEPVELSTYIEELLENENEGKIEYFACIFQSEGGDPHTICCAADEDYLKLNKLAATLQLTLLDLLDDD